MSVLSTRRFRSTEWIAFIVIGVMVLQIIPLPSNRDTVLGRLQASGVRPPQQEPSVRPLLLRDAGLVSPDGRYTALITGHLYSVQDVMVLEKAN